MKAHVCIMLGLVLSLGSLGCGRQAQDDVQAADTVRDPGATYRWKMVTTWPPNFPALGTGLVRLAERVEVMSAGRLRIRVYGAGELVGAFGVFDAVSAGVAEMGHGAAYYWRGKIPEAVFFTAVPFGMTAQEINSWLHYGGGITLWRELYERHNLYPMASGNTGVQMAGWFRRPIDSLADFKGLKMRIPGLGGEVFRRVGGIAVSMPGDEIFTSLQTGVIDAAEWIGPYNDLAFGFYSVADYYYYPGWHEPGPVLEAIVNMDALRALPADLRAILEAAVRATNQDMLDEFTARNNAALQELIETHGVQLRRLPDDVLLELRKASRQALEELAADNPMATRIYESFQAFQENVRAYHAISEQSFLNIRDLPDPPSQE